MAGAVLLAWWLLPFETMNAIAGRDLSMDFSAWIVSGLMVVAGATTSRAFLRAVDDVESFGGGFDLRAAVAPASPVARAGRRDPCGGRPG